MIDLNAGACTAMQEVGVHAATDITGFGLIGHAHEVADASDVTIEIAAPDVPLLEGALELATDGVLTRAHRSNLEYLGSRFEARNVDETMVHLLADAQTSGGLLIAVASDRLEQLLKLLAENETCVAAIVGHVKPAGDRRIILRG
jgi:selenide,water dikinase